MSKTYTGIQVGAYSVKLAQVTDGKIEHIAIETIPNDLMKDGHILSLDSIADFIRELSKSAEITSRKAAVVLSADASFSRRTTMPYMTVDQLKLNLPYEFHDYIQYNKDAYHYDYAVIGTLKDENGKAEFLDLLVAAASTKLLNEYKDTLKKAGFKMALALPENLTYRNIIRHYQENHHDHPKEYCIVDMGHSAIKMHMYNGSAYDTTRVIEHGGASLDSIIADHIDVDIHTASLYKIQNTNNVQDLDVCIDLYNRISVELIRALNFYHYNNPGSSLRDLYFCGGLIKINSLMDIIRATVEGNLHSISELLPEYAANGNTNTDIAPAAIGITMQ